MASKTRGEILRPLTNVQMAYIAGILDGEGCITISRKTDKTVRGGYCFRPLVTVVSTRKNLLAWLKTTTGLGQIYDHNSGRAENHKRAWQWILWSNQAGQLLEAVEPYLIIKSKQASLLLRFIRSKRDGVGRDGLSAREWASQESAHRRIGRFNAKGRPSRLMEIAR